MNEQAAWFINAGYHTVTPGEFYRTIFPAGELAARGEYTRGKYTGIIVAVTKEKKKNGKTKVKRYSLTDDLGKVEDAIASNDFCICAPLSYAGRERTAKNARFAYAIAVDVDMLKTQGVEAVGLAELMAQTQRKMWATSTHNILPVPTFVVCSGSGVHLYYVLKKPVPLYNEYAEELQALKRDLTRRIWNAKVTNAKEYDIQQEGIYQGFRMPGTVTKNGGRALAFHTGERVTLEYLNQFVTETNRAKKAAGLVADQGGLRLEEAKRKYPEWYERRIVRKEGRGIWPINRKVYEWWRGRIADEAVEGHRYYCVMMLAIYAMKCSFYDAKRNPHPVTWKELERDAYNLLEALDARTKDENNHFGIDDIQDALEAYQDRWVTYPRAAIEYRTGLKIPENKRNGRTQETHLRIARNTLEVLNDENGKALQGRKSAAGIVAEWRAAHLDGGKNDCIKETGLARSTIFKYWNGVQQPAEENAIVLTKEEKETLQQVAELLERGSGDKREIERLRRLTNEIINRAQKNADEKR